MGTHTKAIVIKCIFLGLILLIIGLEHLLRKDKRPFKASVDMGVAKIWGTQTHKGQCSKSTPSPYFPIQVKLNDIQTNR